MIGGYQILDLRGLNLEVTEQAQSLTDQNVLKQLTLLLRDSIDKDYNFNKPLENQLKPVLIRFRDKKNGEKIEGATFGELSVKGNYYTFQITARISGALVLTINVAFEEITNDYGNKEWVIDTATILLKDESKTITGDLELSGDLSVGDDAEITGDASVGGALNVTGNVSGAKFIGDVSYESIKDASGHNRFIEGAVTLNPSLEGIMNAYGKWSLSGSHLLVVLCLEIDADVSLTQGTLLGTCANLPSWIENKIYPLKGIGVEWKNFTNINDDWSSTTSQCYLANSDGIKIFIDENKTYEKDNIVRINFDLLIDNE